MVAQLAGHADLHVGTARSHSPLPSAQQQLYVLKPWHILLSELHLYERVHSQARKCLHLYAHEYACW